MNRWKVKAGCLFLFENIAVKLKKQASRHLTTKAQDWQYEQEVRFIYDLSQHSTTVNLRKGTHFIAIPTDALREIIVGFRAAPTT